MIGKVLDEPKALTIRSKNSDPGVSALHADKLPHADNPLWAFMSLT